MGKINLKVATCEGDLSIENTEKWHKKFKALIKKGDDIRLAFKRVDRIDLSFMQLLVSLKKSCLEKNINFEVIGMIPDEIKDKLKTAGMYKLGINESIKSVE